MRTLPRHLAITPSVAFGFCHCGCGERTALAAKTKTARGEIKGQPQRYLHGHAARVIRGTLVQQLECKTEVQPDGCWKWTGASEKGYGRHCRRPAHAVMYETLIGPYDGELHHTCRNRACVNPEHLRPLTRAEHNAIHHLGRSKVFV